MRKAFPIVVLVLTLFPLLVVALLSLKTGDPETPSWSLEWYQKAFQDIRFREALTNSLVLSVLTALPATFLAFLLAVATWNSNRRTLVVILILLWGIIPPAVQGVMFATVINVSGWYALDYPIYVLSMVLGVLPYCTLIVLATLATFDQNLIAAGRDLGVDDRVILRKVVLPLSIPGLMNSTVLAFLLAVNEYAKTFFLSGSDTYISEMMVGKLRSGADPSIYAAGGLNILLAGFFIVVFYVGDKFLNRGRSMV